MAPRGGKPYRILVLGLRSGTALIFAPGLRFCRRCSDSWLNGAARWNVIIASVKRHGRERHGRVGLGAKD